MQLKALSGHKSDTVVQGYIEKSTHTRLVSADALAVGAAPALKRPRAEAVAAGGGVHIHVNLAGATVTGNVQISPTALAPVAEK